MRGKGKNAQEKRKKESKRKERMVMREVREEKQAGKEKTRK